MNPQPPSRTIEPLENLQSVMRVNPQKPTTSNPRLVSNPTRKITAKEDIKTSDVDAVSVSKTINLPNPCSNYAGSFLPLLPKSPVSMSFSSTPLSGTVTAIKESTNSLTITPTVILSTRNASHVGKRKRSVRSMDSNSEVSKRKLMNKS